MPSSPKPTGKTVTKRDLIERIADLTGQPRAHVKSTLQHFLDIITDELAEGNRIEFRDFGVFEVRERAARMAQNPRTLERVPVPAKRSVKFKVGRMMQKRVEGSAEMDNAAAQIDGQADGQIDGHADGQADHDPPEVTVTPAASRGSVTTEPDAG